MAGVAMTTRLKVESLTKSSLTELVKPAGT